MRRLSYPGAKETRRHDVPDPAGVRQVAPSEAKMTDVAQAGCRFAQGRTSAVVSTLAAGRGVTARGSPRVASPSTTRTNPTGWLRGCQDGGVREPEGAGGTVPQQVARLVLAAFMATAGVGHLVATDTFRAQVPDWMPFPEWVIWLSGFVEIGFALALAFAPATRRPGVGWALAAFYVAVFPGNVSQYVTGTAAFGLDSDGARLVRLFLQPVLIVLALWCTGAYAAWRHRARRRQT